MTDSQKHIFRYKMCLNQTNIFNFYSLKGTLLPLRPTHYAKPYNEGLQCFAHSCSLIKFLRFVFEDHEALIEYLSGLARWYYTSVLF